MTLVFRTENHIIATPFGPHKFNAVAIVFEQRLEQVPISAVAGITTAEGDGITKRQDLDGNLLGK
jgi:hypothetical protein